MKFPPKARGSTQQSLSIHHLSLSLLHKTKQCFSSFEIWTKRSDFFLQLFPTQCQVPMPLFFPLLLIIFFNPTPFHMDSPVISSYIYFSNFPTKLRDVTCGLGYLFWQYQIYFSNNNNFLWFQEQRKMLNFFFESTLYLKPLIRRTYQNSCFVKRVTSMIVNALAGKVFPAEFNQRNGKFCLVYANTGRRGIH